MSSLPPWTETSLIVSIEKSLDLVRRYKLHTDLDPVGPDTQVYLDPKRYNLYCLDFEYTKHIHARPDLVVLKRQLHQLVWNTLYETRLSLRDSLRTALVPVVYSDREQWASLPIRLDLGEGVTSNRASGLFQIVGTHMQEFAYYQIVHKALSALYCTNNLDLPNFVYAYAAFDQGYSNHDGLAVDCAFNSWCVLEEARQSTRHDKTQGFDLLRFDLYVKRVDQREIILAYLQLLLALNSAYLRYGYNHNNLNRDTVTVQRLLSPIRIRYETSWGPIEIETVDVVVLESSHRSRFVIDGISYGPYDKVSYEDKIFNVDSQARDLHYAHMLIPTNMRALFSVGHSYEDAISRILDMYVDLDIETNQESSLATHPNLDIWIREPTSPIALYALGSAYPDPDKMLGDIQYWIDELDMLVHPNLENVDEKKALIIRAEGVGKVLDVQAKVHKYITVYREFGGQSSVDVAELDAQVSSIVDIHNNRQVWYFYPLIHKPLNPDLLNINFNLSASTLGIDILRSIAAQADYFTLLNLCSAIPRVCDHPIVKTALKSAVPIGEIAKLSTFYHVMFYLSERPLKIELNRDSIRSVWIPTNSVSRLPDLDGVDASGNVYEITATIRDIVNLGVFKIEIGGRNRYL